MMSRSIILRESLEQIISKHTDSKTVADMFSDLSKDEFDKLMNEALFDIWIMIGDSGYYTGGFHEAVCAIENCLFPRPAKKDNEHVENEQWHDMLYF